MKNLLFDSFHQWKVCFLSGCKKMSWGFIRIVSCLILGVLSVIRWIWRCVVSFISREPVVSLIAFIVILIATWLMTFTSMRMRVVGTEHQRDSISYELSKFTQAYGNDSILAEPNDSVD